MSNVSYHYTVESAGVPRTDDPDSKRFCFSSVVGRVWDSHLQSDKICGSNLQLQGC